MLYKKFRSIPANTTETSPNWQKLPVTKGTIKEWIIFFDPEAANLLHVRIEYHGSSIIPWGGKDWIVGFFSDDPFDDNIELDVPPYELDIYAYNEDDSYPHEYYIHPIILREKPVTVPEEGVEGIWERLKGFVGVD